MESKKINQLATSVNPQTSDLTIIGDPITGVSKKISLLQIANLFATTGTVSSVAVTETGDALTITGSPITSTGTINIAFAGAANQYVRGDGALADFPTSTGGGSSVSYYLNSSVSQGTIGGVAYREFSKDPISGAGTDITATTNGYIASYITDANDPALLEVPAGNFNCEFYFSVNSDAHNPYVYAEIYKYDGSTFTLIGSSQSVPEYLTNGTTISPYYFAIPVTQTALTLTDRIAIRIYANVDTREVTLHTENNHLCQVVTTFSKGLTSLNNLTRQVQFLATGTSGTNFNIVSSGDTHTFNLPVASATNTGKLSSTDWSTFNGKVPYTGATADVDLGLFGLTSNAIKAIGDNSTYGGVISIKQNNVIGGLIGTGYTELFGKTNRLGISFGAGSIAYLSNSVLTAERTYTLPDITGTLALLEGTQTFTGAKTFGSNVSINIAGQASLSIISSAGNSSEILSYVSGVLKSTISTSATEFKLISAIDNILKFQSSTNFRASLIFSNSADYTYTFPAASGTLALSSDLSAYLPLTGGTLTGALSGTSATFSGNSFLATSSGDVGVGTSTPNLTAANRKVIDINGTTESLISFSSGGTNKSYIFNDGTNLIMQGATLKFQTGFTDRLTIASTGAATFSSSVTATQGTFSSAPSIGGYQVQALSNSGSSTSFGVVLVQSANGKAGYLTCGDNSASTWYGGEASFVTLGATLGAGMKFRVDASDSKGITIPTSGNVGIGTSSPAKTLDVYNSANSNTAQIKVGDGGSTARGYLGTFSNNLYLSCGGTFSSGWTTDGTNGIANIVMEATNGGSTISFGTAASNTSPTERMRITSGGYLKSSPNGTYFSSGSLLCSEFDNNTTDTPALFLSQTNTSFTDNVLFLEGYRNTTNNTWYLISGYNRTAGAYKFRVADSGNVTNTNNSYGAISDIKLKENITDSTPKLDDLLKVKIKNFNYIGSEEKQLGVIAQELEEVFPSMIEIHNDKDGEGKDLGTTTKSVKYSVFVPMLIKAIQEQTQIIKDLEARIVSLESK